MNALRFAFASLRYHKQTIRPYWLVSLVFSLVISFLWCLKHSFALFYQQVIQLFSSEQSNGQTSLFSNELQAYINKVDCFYLVLIIVASGSLLLFTAFFLWHFLKKRQDFLIFRNSGITKQWFLQIWLEFLLPALLLLAFTILLFLILQPFLQTVILSIHQKVISFFGMDHLQLAVNTADRSRWLIKLPANGAALFNSIQLPTRSWSLILIQGAFLSFLNLLVINSLLLPLFSLYFYKRRKNNDRHSFE